MIPALRGKWLALLCLLPFALFFIAFQIAPLLWVASNSLQSANGWGLGAGGWATLKKPSPHRFTARPCVIAWK